LKLQSGILELAAGLGELLSRLRQFFGQLGCHFGHLLGDVLGNLFCHLIPKLSELHLNFSVDGVQFVVEVKVRGLLWASDCLARSFGCCGLNCAIFVVSQYSFTAVFSITVHIVFLLH
jgi:hypothetical protein